MKKSLDGLIIPDLPDNASPEDRATYVVLRLEQFIRDGRSLAEGMSFRKWQAMALSEIAANIAEAQNQMVRDNPVTNRLLFTAAASMITIGFWGMAVSVHKVGYLAAAFVIGFAGLVLLAVATEWPIRKFWRGFQAKKRHKRLASIEGLNRKIKKLEVLLMQEAKDMEKSLESARKANQKLASQQSDPAPAQEP